MGAEHLDHPLMPLAHQQEAGSETEEPRLEPAPIGNAIAAGSGLTHFYEFLQLLCDYSHRFFPEVSSDRLPGFWAVGRLVCPQV